MTRAIYYILFSCLFAIPIQAKSPPPQRVQYEDPSNPLFYKLVLFPFYLPELVVRSTSLAMESLLELEEEYHLYERSIDILSNEERTRWIYPTLSVNGDNTLFGIRYTHRNLFNRGYETNLGVITSTEADIYLNAFFGNPRFISRNNVQLGYQFQSRYSNDGKDEFYGLGNNTDEENDELNFSREHFEFTFIPTLKIGKLFYFGFSSTYSNTKIGRPDDDRPIQESSVPLTGVDTTLQTLHTKFSIGYDGSKSQPLPTQGIHSEIFVLAKWSLQQLPYSTPILGTDLKTYIPVKGKKLGFALRLQWQHNLDLGEAPLPFYEQPYLGGDSPLRGFDTVRFIDRGTLLTNIEYRYLVWTKWGVLAKSFLFLDLGRTYTKLNELELSNIHYATGLGFHIHTKENFITTLHLGNNDDDVFFVQFKFQKSI